MTQVYVSASSGSFTTLLTRVRRMVGDVDTSTANQRWSNNEIIDAVNMEISQIEQELGISQRGPFISSETLTYTADGSATTLPTNSLSQPIVRVEDLSGTNPVELNKVSVHDLNAYESSADGSQTSTRRVYAILGDSIAIRPTPSSATSLRIWSMRGPLVIGAESVTPSAVSVTTNVATATVANHAFKATMRISTDGMTDSGSAEADVTDVAITSVTETTIVYPCTAANGSFASIGTISTSLRAQHPLASQADEVICLGAAIRLQEVDSEVPERRRERYEMLLLRYLLSGKRMRGPKGFRKNRRFE